MESEEEPTARIYTTIFPMPIVNNTQDFAYNQRFGAVGQGALGRATSRHGRNSSSGRGNNTHNQPPSIAYTRSNITRSIYVLPHGTIWIEKAGDTLPFVESWPLDSPCVLVSLSSTPKWEGLVHSFPIDLVEHGIAMAFCKGLSTIYKHILCRSIL